MSTLRAILELHGSLDTAVIATQDPRVMETADAFLPAPPRTRSGTARSTPSCSRLAKTTTARSSPMPLLFTRWRSCRRGGTSTGCRPAPQRRRG